TGRCSQRPIRPDGVRGRTPLTRFGYSAARADGDGDGRSVSTGVVGEPLIPSQPDGLSAMRLSGRIVSTPPAGPAAPSKADRDPVGRFRRAPCEHLAPEQEGSMSPGAMMYRSSTWRSGLPGR